MRESIVQKGTFGESILSSASLKLLSNYDKPLAQLLSQSRIVASPFACVWMTAFPYACFTAPRFSESGSFARGRCRQGRSEIPHFCSKLQSFPLSSRSIPEKRRKKLRKAKKSEEKQKKTKRRKTNNKRKKMGNFLRRHLHQNH